MAAADSAEAQRSWPPTTALDVIVVRGLASAKVEPMVDSPGRGTRLINPANPDKERFPPVALVGFAAMSHLRSTLRPVPPSSDERPGMDVTRPALRRG